MKKALSLVLPILLITGCEPKKQVQKEQHNYHEIKDRLIDFANVFDQAEFDYLVYFYSERCAHCNEIKNDVITYYLNSDKDMYFVCTDLDVVFGPQSDLTGIDNIDDFHIFGTPFLVRMVEHKVNEYYAGTRAILSYFDN